MAPSSSRSAPSIGRANGFSLVEMLVVLFVIGLLASVVVLSMPGDERILRNEAERFAARTIAARDEAIVGGAPVALVVGPAGYYFQRRVDGAWLALPGKGFDLAAWKQGTQATVAQPGGRGRIVFDTLGLASGDGAVRLERGDRHLILRIARDGKVTLDAA
ncbi:GspH/FimT family pseudopilin [Novosphingobium sp.]|uniref:GspH/FimT family pseudopilin n=1 Tax=Novosphingobium sp. TaxID=1874826 RepID=UPI00352A23A8